MAKQNNEKFPSVLAFERKLAASDALMYSGCWADIENSEKWNAIKITEKSVRGTISNRVSQIASDDPAKLDAEIQKANLQTVDGAILPASHDTLKVSFTLRIIGNVGIPSLCNSPEYQKRICEIVKSYNETHTFEELSLRYATNIANGRFLWRNRIGSDKVKICVRHIEHELQGNGKVIEIIKHKWQFNAYDYDLSSFDKRTGLEELANVIKGGLDGSRQYAFLKIDAYVLLGEGQEVFPSQELVLKEKIGNKSDKSKILYELNGVAAMHSQKIGNALRTVDTWYPEYDDLQVGPIPAEPYGAVTSRGKAYRQQNNFYTLFDKWLEKDVAPDEQQQHYVMSVIIRGGVFGKDSKGNKGGDENGSED